MENDKRKYYRTRIDELLKELAEVENIYFNTKTTTENLIGKEKLREIIDEKKDSIIINLYNLRGYEYNFDKHIFEKIDKTKRD